MDERDRNIQARGRELVSLAARHFPQEFTATTDADSWPFIGTGLVSRMTTILDSILALQPLGRETDAGTLARSLYEHAVHLAWLAADPAGPRLEQWRRHDLRQRLKADRDAGEHGVELFTDDQREAVEAQVAGLEGADLVLTNLAREADEQWADQLPGMGNRGEVQSFRGLYAILYRQYTAVAHPRYQGMNHFVENPGPNRQIVRLEGQYEGNGPCGMATVVFALALYVAAASLGWPSTEAVTAIFEQYPG